MTMRKKPRRRLGASRTRSSVPRMPVMPDRRLMEQQLTMVGRLLEGRDFSSIEDVNAYLHEVLADGQGQLPEVEPRSPLERAQALVYQALEASGARRARLAH